MDQQHAMFQDYPLSGEVSLSTGTAPTPYHVYDGDGLMLFGRVQASAVAPLFGAEDVFPVKFEDGSVAAGFIFADFRKASMGPHRELQFYTLSSFKEGEVIDNRAMSVPLAMAMRPDWGTLCVKLWNDDRAVIAYNNDYLGLNAAFADFDVSFQHNRTDIAVTVANSAGALWGVDVRDLKRTSFKCGWDMVRIAGIRNMMALGTQPYFSGHVINRKSQVLPDNRKAKILTSSDKSVSKYWNADDHKLMIGDADIAQFGFEPLAVQHIQPFRFTYLHPDVS